LRPPLGLTIAPATYSDTGGVVGVVGVLVPGYLPGGVKMTRQQTSFYKIGKKIAIPLKATDRPTLPPLFLKEAPPV
jgi:hypothetical protein